MKGSTVIWEKSTTPVVTPDYLYIQNTYAGTNDITFTKPDDENTKTLEYSKDLSNWTSFTPEYDTTYKVTLNQGEKLYLRGSNGTRPNLEIWGQRSHIAGGNVNTLLDYTNPNGVSLPQKAFKSLFNGDLYLTDASNLVLPATRLSNYCYSYMFYTCTSLTTAPTLPATTLAQHCYGNMFWGCSSLTTAPTLPATTLTSACYQYMFRDCRALTTTPSLTATNLTNATACYQGMFQGCTSLTTTPSLPATTLTQSCYANMFKDCTSLNEVTTYAEDISASNCLTDWLNSVAATGTFYNNGSATYTVDSASGIPQGWTEVKPVNADYLYLENVDNKSGNVSFVFSGSTSYDTLKRIEYSKDKLKWTSVNVSSTETTIPTNVGEKVYFRNSNGYCNNQFSYIHFNSDVNVNVGGNLHTLLDYNNVNVPIQSDYVFHYLFSGMTKLLDASQLVLPWTTLRNGCYEDMFGYCSSLTTPPELPATTLVNRCYAFMFSKCSSLTSITTYAEDISADSCLFGWVNNVNTVGTFYNNGSATYTTGSDGIPQGWTEVKPSTGPDYFYIENVDSASGNVSFTFYGTPSSDTIQQIEWSKDKTNWTTVTLVANTTTNVPVSVGEKVYFRNSNGKCSNSSSVFLHFSSDINTNICGELYTLLDYTDENVALPQFAFTGLFYQMNKLKNASDLVLRWTTLINYCYWSMFQNCTSLTTAPSLPATTLAEGCYSGMFYGCSSLTTAPSLPATTLAEKCYYSMFQVCSSLTTAPSLPATILADYCYSGMFYGCSNLTTAPSLPATILADYCYWFMFTRCSSLDDVTIYANDISATDCLTNWLSDVASIGIFHNLGSATYPSGTSGIPNGWIEETEPPY